MLTLQRVDTISDAIDLANSLPQGLSASVHTSELSTALEIATALRAGEVWINTHLEQSPEIPHGGRGISGSGIDLSPRALDEWLRPKTITMRFRD